MSFAFVLLMVRMVGHCIFARSGLTVSFLVNKMSFDSTVECRVPPLGRLILQIAKSAVSSLGMLLRWDSGAFFAWQHASTANPVTNVP